jgi:hypothetical protein
MGNFVNLVSVVLGESLLITARSEVRRLSVRINECNHLQKDPMFTVELGFDSTRKPNKKLIHYFDQEFIKLKN